MPSVASAPSSQPVQSSTTNKATNALHLPANVIATIAPETYFLAHLQSEGSIRPSGRTPDAFRPIAITTSSLTNCLGSAVVRNGNTAVVCGITPELLYANEIADPPPARKRRRTSKSGAVSTAEEKQRRKQDTQDIAHLHLLVPNIDLNTGSSTSNQPGQAPTAFAQSLSQRLHRLLLSTDLIDIEDLRITRPKEPLTPQAETPDPLAAGTAIQPDSVDQNDDEEDTQETVAYYTLHMNLTVLSLDGHTSLFDTAWAATLAALQDLRLPRAYWDGEREMVLCSDLAAEAKGLTMAKRPVVCSWGVFESRAQTAQGVDVKSWILADVDGFEEGLCKETCTIVLDNTAGQTRLLRVEKSGGGVVDSAAIGSTLLEGAEKRWKEVIDAMPPARGRDR